MSAIVDRIKGLMASQGLSVSELARDIGATRQAVDYWLAGRNNPSSATIGKLADRFGVSTTWLKTGKGEAHACRSVTVADEENDSLVWIPSYRLAFHCGAGSEAPEWIEDTLSPSFAYRREFFQARHINPRKCRRVIAEGDSMQPLICNGDHVLFVEVPEGEPIKDGKVYALSYGGALRIKRLRQKINGDLTIISENPDYPPETVPAQEVDGLIRIYGIVIERSGSI